MSRTQGTKLAWIQPSTYPRKLYWTWRYLGWWNTVGVVLVKPVERILGLFGGTLWYQDFTERMFDRRFGVTTHARLQLGEIGDLPAEQLDSANEYGPTRVMDFGYIMSQVALDHRRYDFLDIGSGQGKALLLAAWFPFRSIVGVELSTSLHAVAQDNIVRYTGPCRADSIVSMNADALTADLPSRDFMCFLFNPFDGDVLALFVERLEASIRDDPRHVLLIYGNGDPEHVAALDNSSLFRPRPAGTDDQYLVYETVQS